MTIALLSHADRIRAIVARYTAGQPWCLAQQLAGGRNTKARQDIMEVLTGVRLPGAKCGVNAMQAALVQFAGITGATCQADEDDKLRAWLTARDAQPQEA